MNLTIEPLTPARAADYFDFFDNRAFTDDSPYRCYCISWQMTKEQAAAFAKADADDVGRAAGKVAERQIASGVLKGYLAFADGVSIGWCNANDKASLPAACANGSRLYSPPEKRERAVLCFEIAPEYRGKGVATALLQRVIADAKADGCFAIEGYPVKHDERYKWDFTGPLRLYEKAGFAEIARCENKIVMRKVLSPTPQVAEPGK
ncbi:MAG: GNAT family N-acetyltransferase [Oscillospiraceae bacterium]|jgi:GNAT superfamily N-acetyltransferase|nr:GNAT family N-acetyltransferase [Oscillospiraceae bacterium]